MKFNASNTIIGWWQCMFKVGDSSIWKRQFGKSENRTNFKISTLKQSLCHCGMILKSKNYITFKEVITGIVKVLPICHSVICAKVILFLKWKCQGKWLQKVIFFCMDLGHFPKIIKNRLKKGTNYSINSVISVM